MPAKGSRYSARRSVRLLRSLHAAAMVMIVVVPCRPVAVIVVMAAAMQMRAMRMAAFVFMIVPRQAVLAFQVREGQADSRAA